MSNDMDREAITSLTLQGEVEEELEDKETATTEVLLKGDETVEVGETDGPIPTKCTGTWSLSDDNDFKMVLTRTFEAGKQETKIR